MCLSHPSGSLLGPLAFSSSVLTQEGAQAGPISQDLPDLLHQNKPHPFFKVPPESHLLSKAGAPMTLAGNGFPSALPPLTFPAGYANFIPAIEIKSTGVSLTRWL